jgi:hypothetical protein
MRHILIIVSVSALLSAQSWGQDVQEEPVNRSGDWFLAHPDEIPPATAWCREHPDEASRKSVAGDDSCTNASIAQAAIIRRKTDLQFQNSPK